MKEDTIYEGLTFMYQKGKLFGEDLKQYKDWQSARCNREEFKLKVDECINGHNAIDNMVNGYKVKLL